MGAIVKLSHTKTVLACSLAAWGLWSAPGCSSEANPPGTGGGAGADQGLPPLASAGAIDRAEAPAGGTGSSAGGAAGRATGGTQPDAGLTDKLACGAEGCQCNNGKDDDGDGQIDGFDVECVGPYDDDEGTFATGIPGDNSDPKWQDCFFDGNSGAGDDGCRYSTRCLTGELEPSDPDCRVTQECIDFCIQRTPNGCDCFGCCQVIDATGDEHFVYASGQCNEHTLDDPDVCIPCTQSTQCSNECGGCQLCPGMKPEDLPASCGPQGSGGAPGEGGAPGTSGDAGAPPVPPNSCDEGLEVCSPEWPCPGGTYCMNGCCMHVLL
jgi:hypothetical protein